MAYRSGSRSELLGAAEVCELLGVTRASVCERRESPDFPEPLAVLRATPIWSFDAIRQYAARRVDVYPEGEAVESLAKATEPRSCTVPLGEAASMIGERERPVAVAAEAAGVAEFDENGNVIAVERLALGWLAREIAVAQLIEITAA